MRRFILGVVILLMLLPAAGVGAIGSSDDWKVILFNPTEDGEPGGELVVVTNSGLKDAVPLPDSIFEEVDNGFVPGRIGISPDLRFLVVTYASVDQIPQPMLPLQIIDRETDTVFDVAAPIGFPLVYNYNLNPEGTQVAISYVGGDDEDALNNNEIRAGLMLVELASGETLAQIDIDDINAEINPNGEWALLTSWAEGSAVPFVPGCFLCNRIEPNHIWLWDASTDSFTESEQFYFPSGALLAESGEVLIAKLNEDFPIGRDDPAAYLPPSNVIEYYAAGSDPREPGKVVYFDEGRYPLGGSPWVQDGRAFLTRKQGDESGVLVFRDGSVQEFTLPEGPVVVSGTPDGAIVIDERGIVYDYRVVNGEVQSQEVFELNFSNSYNLGGIAIIYSTPIGASSGGKPFPVVPEPGNTAMLPVQ